ncbi:beta-galactosidase [Parvularcula maris]|uniref:Beta-galactosidase n=1 Tax=Parvularcula maris TaxID=2965077 RepID=A0A9X2LAF9_9PROT|nr:beta-galactosidase [Parvularcula maris]MCQ8186115.1 beta-galactosidase [Parvularcula maris]
MLLIMLIAAIAVQTSAAPPPELETKGEAVQLHMDGEPFLIRGGELGNSTASDLDALSGHWETFQALGLNTLLAPVSWELIEPVESEFDFSSVEGLVAQTRQAEMRLVLLWFGSYKNSMSSYVPAWVKRDTQRFPRVRAADGTAQEMLSPYAPANWEADAKAFRMLMDHLRRIDGQEKTVIMVQVENEVGLLPNARDHSPDAEAVFAEAPPSGLLGIEGRNWRDAVGTTPQGEEKFSAWGLARYVNHVAEAGLEAYDLPLFVNAALNRPGALPGQYPSDGPLDHLFEL